MWSKQRAFKWQRHGVAQRVVYAVHRSSVVTWGRMALQARITVAALMMLCGALGRA